jgi:hypothetical protein
MESGNDHDFRVLAVAISPNDEAEEKREDDGGVSHASMSKLF